MSDDNAEKTGDEVEPDPGQRSVQQALWLDTKVRHAIERGDFDDLPGTGKPIPGLGGHHDPDWWVKRLVEREKISVLPPALALRNEAAELDATLDRETTELAVRRAVEDFNARIIHARRQLAGGPPVITATRNVDDEVEAWQARRSTRLERLRLERVQAQTGTADSASPSRRRWPFRRR